jgi:hypothetical protein
MNERRYAMQDGNWNTIAICDTTGSVGERYAYSAYGAPVFMTGAGTVQSSSPIGFETLYAGYRWDNATPQMYYVRNRFLLPQVGTWNRRDPLGYVDGMSLAALYVQLSSTDSFGLFAVDTARKDPPGGEYIEGYTNCAGYALDPSGEGTSLQPTESLKQMAEGVGQTCYVRVGAKTCGRHCRQRGFRCHTMGYLYIVKSYNREEMIQIRNALLKLAETHDSHVMRYGFRELNAWLCKKYGFCRNGGPLDFHFLKGNCGEDDYTYQPCHAGKNSAKDCRLDPKVFNPTEEDPDYFAFPQGVGKMCCCSDRMRDRSGLEHPVFRRRIRGLPVDVPGVRRM